jgi:hypothetical protein
MLTPWFMSPWHATRMVLEAQHLVTFSVLRLLSGPPTKTVARRLNDRDGADTAQESVTSKRPKTLAAQRALGVNKKQVRPKNKRASRKRKG